LYKVYAKDQCTKIDVLSKEWMPDAKVVRDQAVEDVIAALQKAGIKL